MEKGGQKITQMNAGPAAIVLAFGITFRDQSCQSTIEFERVKAAAQARGCAPKE